MTAIQNLLSLANIMKSVGGVLLAVTILLVMITVHEFGHYLAGKRLGFKINEFAIGFGPAIFKKRSKKTGELFSLRVIPLGGYCAFDGEDEFADEQSENTNTLNDPIFEELPKDRGMSETNANISEKTDKEYPEPKGARFNDQAPWKRIIVLVAGATMNYLLALLLLIGMFAFIGRPLYQVTVEKPEESQPTSVAQTATESEIGLQTGDIILQINGKDTYLVTDYIDALNGESKGAEIPVLVLRDGERVSCIMTLAQDAHFANTADTQTLLKAMNIYGLRMTTQKQDFFQTIGGAFVYSFKIGGMVLRSLGELLTGKIGLESMGGPITTIKVTSEAASSSVFSFLNIAALIGVNLAVFNLLPVPALDGCKVIFCLIEWIRKKPVNRKVEAIIHTAGILFLFAFAILVDILQFL